MDISSYYNIYTLLFFIVFVSIIVVTVYQFVPNTKFELPNSQQPDKIVLDLNIPVHVIPSTSYNTRIILPNGRFDGDSITLVNDYTTYGSPTNVVIEPEGNIRASTYTGHDIFYPFYNNGSDYQNQSAIFKLIWLNNAWNIDNNDYD